MSLLNQPTLVSALLIASAGTSFATETILDNPILAGLRFTERLIVAGAGVLLVYLGYKLFAKAADRAAGNLTVSIPDRLKLQMESIGPGVFFAFFGTVMLIYVMASQIQVSVTSVTDGVVTRNNILLGGEPIVGLSQSQVAEQRARALGLLERFAMTGMVPTPGDRKRLQDAAGELESLMANLVDDAVRQRGAYALWKGLQAQSGSPGFPDNLPDADKLRWDNVNRIMTGEAP